MNTRKKRILLSSKKKTPVVQKELTEEEILAIEEAYEELKNREIAELKSDEWSQ